MSPPLTMMAWVVLLSSIAGITVNAQTIPARSTGRANADLANSIAVNSSEPIYTRDNLIDTVAFEPAPGTKNLNDAINPEILAANSGQFCVTAPTITSFFPASGPIGTAVTISGTGFDPVPSNNIVFFGATRANVTSAAGNSLTVTVPIGTTYQYITVTNTCNLTAYSADPFIVTFSCGGSINSSSFTPKVDFVAGSGPRWVSIVDLDGDGKADMAVPFFPNQLAVFKNTGASGIISFAPKVDIPIGIDPQHSSFGDLDGDGKPDLVTSNYSDIGANITVLRNTSAIGAISFAPGASYITGNNAILTAIGDIDGDGKPDLVVVNWSGSSVSVLRNTSVVGAISFAPKIDLATGINPYGLTIGDLDGDGKPDLAVTVNVSNTLSIFRNLSTTGSISFAPKIDFTTGSSPLGLSTGDLDGDGKPDLAVSDLNSNMVSIFRNISTPGNISLAPKVDFTTGATPFANSLTDLDGDGKPDLALSVRGSNAVSVLRNTGTSGTISFAPKVDFATGSGPFGLAIGDLDGDGKPDMAVANLSSANNSVSILRNTITPPPPSVTITAFPAGPICAGTSVTFTATPVNGGSTLNYQWQVNGINVGTNSPTYTSATLANGDNIMVSLTSISACPPDITVPSNTITMIVNPSFTPSVTLTANPAGAICAGTPVTFTATAANTAGGTVTYTFKVNGISVQTGGSNLYSTSTLANGNTVTCDIFITGGSCLISNTATSNTITMLVNPILTPSVTITASPAGPVCANTPVTFTATAVNTGGGSLTYNFKVNGITVQSSASNTYTTSTLASGNTISCDIFITGGACLSISTATSNTITMAVNPNLTPTVTLAASPAGAICAATPVTFTATAASTGGGSVIYTFKVNGISVQSSASNTYTSSTLANSNTVTCDITITGGTCLTSNTATSNTITMAVNPNFTPTVTLAANPAGSICAGVSVTFTATAANTGGGSVSYIFKVNGITVQSGVTNTYTTSTLANGNTVTCDITVTGGTCLTSNTATSNTITMAVNPNLTPIVTLAASPGGAICAGTSVTFTATAANTGGGSVIYDFKVNGISVQSSASNAYTTSTLTNGNTVTCDITVTGGTCLTSNTATSNTITMAVNPNLTPTVTLAASPAGAICAGVPVTFTATAANTGGGSLTYNFKVNGISVQSSVSNTYTTSTLANGNTVTCDITVTGGTCLTSNIATSNTITMAVNPNLTPTVTLTANPAGAICASTSITFTATATNTGGGSVIYNFKVNGISVQSSASNTYTTSTLANGNTVTCDITVTGGTCLTSNIATSNTITMAVNPNLTPTVTLAASPAAAICAGTSVTFMATATNTGGGSLIYIFKVNGTSVQSTASNTYTTSTLTNGNTITCDITITGGTCLTSNTATSNTITMAVNPNLTPTVTLAASPAAAICAGTSVTFTATAVNTGGGSVNYTFKVNGISVQSTASNTYTTSTLANGNTVTCDITITGGTCLTSNTATSNTITMAVNPNLTPTVTLTASPAGAICAGTSVTFTATATSTGAGSVAYDFKVNGVSVQNGVSNTYTNSTLVNGNTVTCDITITGGTCLISNTATSNTITMLVNPNLTPSVTLAASPSGSICAGTPVTFTATAANTGAGSVTYNFKVNGITVQTGVSNIYTTSTLANGNTVTCDITVTGGTCLTSNTAASNSITMLINPSLTPTVTLAANPTGSICAGTAVSFTATATNTGSGSVTYNFKINGISVQNSVSNTYTTSTLANGNTVTCDITITGGTCLTSNTATSNSITMLVNPNLTPTVTLAASPAGAICAGTSVTFTATATNTGGGSVVYDFKVNGVSSQTGASNTYTVSTLTNGNTITCDITITGGTCLTSNIATSNTITIAVNPNLTPTVTLVASPGGAICAGTSVTFTATAANTGAGSVTYNFKVNGITVQTGVSNIYTTSTLANGNTVSCDITIAGGTCLTSSTATSNMITMLVNPTLTPTVTLTASPVGAICAGTSVTFTATAANTGGGSVTFTFKVNGTSVQTGISNTYTVSTLTNGNTITTDITISGGTCLTSSNATSNIIQIVVNPNLTPTVAITASPAGAICAGTAVTFTATPTNGGSAPSYQWQVNGINVGTNAPNYSSAALVNGDMVSVVMVSNAACVAPSTATSNVIPITISSSLSPSVTIAASASTICPGTSVTFTATPTNGGPTAAYQWQVNGVNVGTNAATYTTTVLANGDIVTVIMTSSAACALPPTATSNAIAITVSSSVSPSVTIVASSTSICPGSSVTFTATPANGGTAPAYQWKVNGIIAGTNAASYTTTTLVNGDIVTVTMTSNSACAVPATATSNAIGIIVSAAVSPTVTIAASSTTICPGTLVTFTATPTNGGTTPAYQWQVNGINVGVNAAVYTSAALVNADVVKVMMTSNAACVSPATASSNAITITVSASVTPSVTITASSTTICPGSSVTFTSTATNGGTTAAYQWQLNGVNVGTNASTYSSAALVNGDIVKVIMTSSAACAVPVTATSNAIVITVSSSVIPSVIIAASSTTICPGASVTFTATPTNGGTTPGYQWQVNGVNVGTNAATYTSAALVNGDIVKVIMTSNSACASPLTATSNAVTITVSSVVSPSVTIAASSTTICPGTSVVFTATPTNGGTTPAYQWQVDGVNVGTNAATYTTAALVNGDIITVTMTSSSACASPATAISNTISITVSSSVIPAVSVVASSANICTGTSVIFTATPTNGGTTPVYQWQVNGVNVGANSATYSSAALANGDLVRVIMTSNASCAIPATATSNTVAMVVSPPVTPSVAIVSSATTICPGTLVTFTATPTNGGVTPAYQWKVNGVNTGLNAATYSSAALVNGDIVTVNMVSNASCAAPATVTSNALTMTVTPALTPTVAIVASATTICPGTLVIFTATPTNGGVAPFYQWQVNGVNVGTNVASYNSAALVNGDIVRVMLTSNAPCATPATVTSNTVAIIVSSSLSASVNIAASSTTICPGSSVTFTATPTNGGTAPSYQWQVNGVNVGTNAATYTTTTLVNGDMVNVMMAPNLPCASSTSVLSNTLSMTVSSVVTPLVSIAASATAICAGTPVTFTASPANGGTAPVYQWQVNAVNAGTNAATYTSATLANGDMVTVTMVSNAACANPATVTSNSIPIVVTAQVVPSLTIVSLPGTICLNTPVTFNALPVNGGTTPSFQWKLNGTDVGTNNSSYHINALNDADIISATMISNAACANPKQVVTNFKVVIDPLKCPKGFYMPTGFTPNRDSKNDLLKPLLFGNVVQYRFSIFNRWGQKIFETSDLQKGWDGKVGGIDADPNVFVWVCSFQFQGQSPENRKGTFVLIR